MQPRTELAVGTALVLALAIGAGAVGLTRQRLTDADGRRSMYLAGPGGTRGFAEALTLDGQGLLRYHASHTPAEVARAARLAADDRERLRALVQALYGYVFGGRPCAPDDYRRWRETSAGPWHAAAH